MADTVRSGNEQFGRALQARRAELGLSRRDLVAASGLSYPYVSQLETGYRLPSQKSLHRLAQALQMAPSELSAAIAFEPHRLAAMPASASAEPAADQWKANPAFRASALVSKSRSPRRRRGPDEVAADAAELISSLPVEDRLGALAELQQRVVDQLVEDRSRRHR